MPRSAQSAQSSHCRKLHKRYASSHLRGDADQVREGPWRVGASLLKSNLALAGYAKCNGRQCKVHVLDRGRKDWPPGGLARAPKKSCQECPSFRHSTSEGSRRDYWSKATSMRHQSHPKAPSKRVNSQLIGTLKPPQCVPNAPPKPPQSQRNARGRGRISARSRGSGRLSMRRLLPTAAIIRQTGG
jgi:hypothetical protein